MKDGLTPKREKFCQEMAKLGNQRHAYKNSFNCKKMKDETIDRRACELMKDGKIRARLQELAEEIKSEAIADAEEIQMLMTKLLRGEEIEEVPMSLDGEFFMAKKKVTPKDRIKAGETLAKMRGYFDIKIKVENAPQIINNVPRVK
jgi:phage terminase small subunit